MDYLEQFWATCADYLRTFWKFLATDAPALGVVLTFLTLLVALAALRHQLRKKPQPPEPTDSPRAQRDRAAMLTKTRREWVDEWLERDLYHEARLELQLTEQRGAVEPRVRHYTRGPDGPGREYARGIPIEQVFDGASGQLLILGEPGTGKSTKLVELARALIDRAKNDPSHPIPVILNLSTWTKKRAALDEWMQDELVRLYGVSPERAKQWVGSDELLPLLDGLDEVARDERTACVTAINTYRQAHGLQPLAVCCRREEYNELPARLDLANAVEVAPLARKDVERYLNLQGFKLARVRRALDEDVELWSLMDTPLMLTVLFLASAAEADAGATEPDARRRLYGRYVKAMFERPRERRFSREKVLRWLGWLAAELSNRNQIPFALEDLDPSWLPSRPAQRAAKWLPGLVGGLVGGLLLGLVLGLLIGLTGRLSGGLVVGLLMGLLGGLVGGLAGGLVFGFLIGSVVAVVGGLVGELFLGLFLGLLVGLSGRLVFGRETLAAGRRPVDRLRIDRGHLPEALVGGVVVGLVFGLLVGLGFGLGGGLGGGLVFGVLFGLGVGLDEAVSPAPVSERSSANEGTRRSLRYAFYISSAGIVFSLILTWAGYALGGRTDAAGPGMADAILFLAPVIALGGGWLGLRKGGYFTVQHVVVRALLRGLNLAPWAYVSFLDEGKDHLFLRKTGGVYQFFHVTFRDFMAETYGPDWLAEPPPPDPATLAADAS